MKRISALLVLLSACSSINGAGRHAGALLSKPKPVDVPSGPPIAAGARLAVTWIGHATVLIQIGDKFILTDPVIGSLAAVVSKRVRDPAVRALDLPPLDAVAISHMHGDHYSLGSLERLKPKIRHLILPENGLLYAEEAPYPITELATWQRTSVDDIEITAVPVQHTGYRYGADKAWMPRAFTGYVFRRGNVVVYFGGDSAYARVLFTEVRRRFGRIDLALLPIAPMEPRQIVADVHMNPGEALTAFEDLGAEVLVPMHYDTFVMGIDNPGEAVSELGAEAIKRNLSSQVKVLVPGITTRIGEEQGEPQ
jgi:N-acyl-phosphatidylethanolamine-hydrolysing phospholipase D